MMIAGIRYSHYLYEKPLQRKIYTTEEKDRTIKRFSESATAIQYAQDHCN